MNYIYIAFTYKKYDWHVCIAANYKYDRDKALHTNLEKFYLFRREYENCNNKGICKN